jgi:hypothetical protein
MKKIIALCILCITLSGCSTLMSGLASLAGGTSSKGHGNDNELVIGSDVTKGVNTGDKTEIETDDVHGDVTNGDKTNTGDNKGNVTVGDKNEYNADVISLGLNWWQALIVALIAGLVIPSPLGLLRRRRK